MLDIFEDSPEYKLRKAAPFKPPTVTLAELRAGIPKHLYQKSTLKGFYYFLRDVTCLVVMNRFGCLIDPVVKSALHAGHNIALVNTLKYAAWCFYLHWQGVIFAGLWCLGHEAGHGTLSDCSIINNTLGFILHTFLLTPYYAWRSTHHAHHRATMSVERDENYVPRTRIDYQLPAEGTSTIWDYHEVFEDTPIYTLLRMLLMQAIGMQFYFLTNAMGSPMYPPGTNHFNPSSPLFKPHERNGIIASNVGLSVMASLLYVCTSKLGVMSFILHYFIPYILANHWIVMLTYLHHSDPTIPHYRAKQWTYLRGALATVDRPFLGWAGRFFLHNVSHDHISHHLNSSIPFYNQPQATEHIKMILGGDYNYDSTNTFRALYRTFTECCFIEDEGDIVFYKNKDGKASRHLAHDALENVPRLAF
ncbi:delta-12 fatty acid desaturase [Crucibulum laeve]|uniref:Delta-12 fatty acid desaturase n=1 Tax=Crucibulum laeve TaxID=68775 RepID=A0A5C3LH29_9AGAR|nr:delta-12 fatty acid desaturase [Crucibulum laeve]